MATGTSQTDPQLLDRADLDLSELRRHCREHHREAPRRSNRDLAGWHWNRHHRYPASARHIHRGLFTLIKDRRGRKPVGAIPRPLGWFTGQDMVTRDQLRQEFRERIAERHAHDPLGGQPH